MVGSCDVLDPAASCSACPSCGFRSDANYTAPNFRLRSTRYDLSCCYDGTIISSQLFREACQCIGADNRLRFVVLPRAPGFLHMVGAVPVASDDGHGHGVAGSVPHMQSVREPHGFRYAVLRPGQGVRAHELAFSEQRYRSHNEAIALLLAGQRFMEMLRDEANMGIDSVEAVPG